MKQAKQRCKVCGKVFKRNVFWQKFCSTSCRQASWAINKLDKTILKKLLTSRLTCV